MRAPVHDGNVRDRLGARLPAQEELPAIRRKLRVSFGDIGSVGQVSGGAAAAGNGEQIVDLATAAIRVIDDVPAVARPHRAELAVIGLAELDGPASARRDFPEVEAAGEVGGEHYLRAIGRPRRAGDGTRVVEIVNGNGTGLRVGAGSDCLRISRLARFRAGGRLGLRTQAE